MLDDLSFLGEYLAEFAAQPATPSKLDQANDRGGLLVVKGLQHALNKLGFKGANNRPLVEDGAWGKNSEAALTAYIAKNRARFGNPKYEWKGKTTPQRVFLFPDAMFNELVIAAGASAADPTNPEVAKYRTDLKPTSASRTPAASAASSSAPLGGKGGGKIIAAAAAQDILNKLGFSVGSDGIFGPKTADAWRAAARARGYQTFIVRGSTARSADVNPATYEALLAASVKAAPDAPSLSQKTSTTSTAPVPAPTTAATPIGAGQMKISVGEAQDILIALGAKQLKPRDGLFGPKTANQWAASAKKRGQDGTFKRIDGMNALVSSAAYATLAKAAGAVPGAAVPPSAQTEKITVERAQGLLNKLGAKLVADGKYGPNTAGAWAAQARSRNQDPLFQRIDGFNALVSSPTLAAIMAAASSGAPAPKPAPTPAPTPTPKPAAKESVKISVASAQKLLNARGAKLKPDGDYGPNTKKAWGTAALKVGANPLFDRVDGKTARVDPDTLAKLSAAAGVPAVTPTPAPAPTPAKPADKKEPPSPPKTNAEAEAEKRVADTLIKKADTLVSVKLVQQAILEVNTNPGSGAFQGAFPLVRDTGVWDDATQDAMLRLFKRDSAQGKRIYAIVFRKTVSKDNKSVKLEKNDAASLAELARRWNARTKKPEPAKPVADKKPGKKPDAKKPSVAETLKADAKKLLGTFKSYVSVALIQYAILRLLDQQKKGQIPGPKMPQVKVTGKWDADTLKGFLLGWGSYIWPGKGGEEIKKFLIPLLLVSDKPVGKGFSAVGGYLILPSAIATNIQQLASAYLAEQKKKPGGKTPPVISPGPGGQVVQGPTIPVSGEVPSAPALPAPAAPPITAPAMEPAGEQPVPGAPVLAPAIPNISINAQGGGGGSTTGGGGTFEPAPPAPGAEPPTTGAPAVPAPESQPTAPASSSGAGPLLFGAAAVAAGLFFLSKGNKKPASASMR